MKQFFEQYGSVALGILALLVLIAMITPVGNIIKTSLQGTAQTFSTGIENQHEDALEATTKIIENSTYLTLDGDYNGLHYHNDELFTGDCENSHLTYINGVPQITYLQPSGLHECQIRWSPVVGDIDIEEEYKTLNSIEVKYNVVFLLPQNGNFGVYYDAEDMIDGHIYYYDTDIIYNNFDISYYANLHIENGNEIDNTNDYSLVVNGIHSAAISKFERKVGVHNAMVFYIYGLNGFKKDAVFGFENIRAIDLTATYGAGNEPTTIEQVVEDLHL